MRINPLQKITGVFQVPGDKSISHRAIMFNALAMGTAKVTNALLGLDCLSTIECMKKLGARIEVDGSTVTVTGAKRLKSGQNLYVGNSGTTIRLLCGLLAGRGVSAVLSGDDSLNKRPMERVAQPLRLMGAKITTTKGCAPIKIKSSSLKGIEYTMPVNSAQVKSAIILAALNAEGSTIIHEPVKTRDHTERMLTQQSAGIKVEGNTIIVHPTKELRSVNVEVPGDISSAAYLMVLAAVLPGSSIVIKNVGVNPTRTGIIDVMRLAGVNVNLLNKREAFGEPVADIMVTSGNIRPFEIGGEIIPRLIDELPVIAVLACFAPGKSVIYDAGELKVKESNRIDRVVSCLRSMGVKIEPTDDGMIIHGGGVINGGCAIDAGLDHRIAMSMAVAGALSLEGVEIANSEIANVSYPGFYDIFNQEAK